MIRPYEQDEVDTIFRMRSEGRNLPEIAAAIGRSYKSTWSAVRRFPDGVMKRPAYLTPVYIHSRAEITTTIKHLIEEGHSYGVIAVSLGTTRSRIAGLVARHCRDVSRSDGVERKVLPHPNRVETLKASKVAKATKAPPPALVRTKPFVEKPEPTFSTEIIPFARATGCRWPLWSMDAALEEKAVCGNRSAGQTYCPEHAALAYRPAEKRRAA